MIAVVTVNLVWLIEDNKLSLLSLQYHSAIDHGTKVLSFALDLYWSACQNVGGHGTWRWWNCYHSYMTEFFKNFLFQVASVPWLLFNLEKKYQVHGGLWQLYLASTIYNSLSFFFLPGQFLKSYFYHLLNWCVSSLTAIQTLRLIFSKPSGHFFYIALKYNEPHIRL